jgi:hypothetical protein
MFSYRLRSEHGVTALIDLSWKVGTPIRLADERPRCSRAAMVSEVG